VTELYSNRISHVWPDGGASMSGEIWRIAGGTAVTTYP